MKRPKEAILIEQFLSNVDAGLIVGRENSSGPIVLENVRKALRSVLDGMDPDEALRVVRGRGADQESYTLPLAILVDRWRREGDTWAVVEVRAKRWMQQVGFRPLSLSRIKAIHKEQAAGIERRRSIQRLLEFFEAKQPGNST